MTQKDREEVTSLIVGTLLRFEEEKLIIERNKSWYKKPIGIIIIGVSTMLMGTGIITFFASFSGSQKGLIQVQSEVKSNTKATIRNTKAVEKVDGKVEEVKGNLNKTDKEWRDAVKEFYKDNPQSRSGGNDSNIN